MNAPLSIDGACLVSDRGLIRASGADAAGFLQGQLTNDVIGLSTGQARLAGFCSAKGRLQASFVVWRDGPEDFLLMCPVSVLAPTLKRLSMFVLRAKCRLSDASADHALWGVAGYTAEALLADMAVWSRRELAEGSLIRLPDAAGLRRALRVAPAGGGQVAETSQPSIELDAWRWLEVESGIVAIEAAIVDRFVPQMVNFELVGGVDFQKGCFPGQEVVARSQYRGTTKRRTFLFDCDELPVPGTDVFAVSKGDAADDVAEASGTVANAAPRPGGGASALIEMRLNRLDAGSLHLGSPSGALLRQTALPYPVVREAEPAA